MLLVFLFASVVGKQGPPDFEHFSSIVRWSLEENSASPGQVTTDVWRYKWTPTPVVLREYKLVFDLLQQVYYAWFLFVLPCVLCILKTGLRPSHCKSLCCWHPVSESYTWVLRCVYTVSFVPGHYTADCIHGSCGSHTVLFGTGFLVRGSPTTIYMK